MGNRADLELAFDVGHSSIGWAVLKTQPELEMKGCGTVIFRPDDCLASKRRDYRRQRRHIRSTRLRIERMTNLLLGIGAITQSDVESGKKQHKGEPPPWLLAARVLAARTETEKAKALLTWPELWKVLRWYAHNRGYDANVRWSGESKVEAFSPSPQINTEDVEEQAVEAEESELADVEVAEDSDSDSDKLRAGKHLMSSKYGFHTATFAETVAKILLGPKRDVKPGQAGKTGKLAETTESFSESDFRKLLFDTPTESWSHPRHLSIYFKGIRAAFPRRIVKVIGGQRTLVGGTEWEVRAILRAHFDAPKGKALCDETFEAAICGRLPKTRENWRAYAETHPTLYLSSDDQAKLRSLRAPPKASQEKSERIRQQRRNILTGKLFLPSRYEGGLLFGQLGTRFFNRIISRCPFSFARIVAAILSGDENTLRLYGTTLAAVNRSRHSRNGVMETDLDLARRWAAKLSKVPAAKSREFLLYRWAMTLANVIVARPGRERLTGYERRCIHRRLRRTGYFTKDSFKEAVRQTTGCEPANLDQMFDTTTEAENSLFIDPVRKYLATNEVAGVVLPVLSQFLQVRLARLLQKGKGVRVREIAEWLDETAKRELSQRIEQYVQENNAKAKAAKKKPHDTHSPDEDRRKKQNKLTAAAVLRVRLEAPLPKGRASYHRVVLRKAVAEVLKGFDPRKPKRDRSNPDGENKPSHGCLFRTPETNRQLLGNPNNEAEYERWKQRWLSHQKNYQRYIARERLSPGSGEAFVRSEYHAAQSYRWLASQSNNHIVRHRLTILDRLLRDIIADQNYCAGDPKRIRRISIEVANDILTFSGLERKQLSGQVMPSLREHHDHVVRLLQQELKGTQWENKIDGELIWKAKIADDLGWWCPYTGKKYSPCELASGEMDVDHIIPKSRRLTNAMSAVVVTFKTINNLKGDLTAWEFVERYQDQPVGPHGEKVRKLWDYERFVKNPDNEMDKPRLSGETGHSDYPRWPKYLPGSRRKLHPDYVRRKLRRRYLLLKHYEKDKDTFTPRDLTITSHLNRLAQQVLLRSLPHLAEHQITAIPGSVIGVLRDAPGWRLLGCLDGAATADVIRKVLQLDHEGKPMCASDVAPLMKRIPKPKGEIRELTHLHHAVDACAIAIINHLLPKDGKLWELVAKRELTDADKNAYDDLRQKNQSQWQPRRLARLFSIVPNLDDKGQQPKHDHKWRIRPCRLKDVLPDIGAQVNKCLRERRVVEHTPADMSGLAAEETVWRIFDPSDNHPSARRLKQWFEKKIKDGEIQKLPDPTNEADKTVLIVCRKRRDAKSNDKGKTLHDTGNVWRWVYDEVNKVRVVGLNPGKLHRIKAVKLIRENFGIALDPEPTIVPFHKVWQRLMELKAKNGGKMPRVLRNGQLIRVLSGSRAGLWRVTSVKQTEAYGLVLDLAYPDSVHLSRPNAPVEQLLKEGLEILKHSLTGYDASVVAYAPVKRRPRKPKAAQSEQ